MDENREERDNFDGRRFKRRSFIIVEEYGQELLEVMNLSFRNIKSGILDANDSEKGRTKRSKTLVSRNELNPNYNNKRINNAKQINNKKKYLKEEDINLDSESERVLEIIIFTVLNISNFIKKK